MLMRVSLEKMVRLKWFEVTGLTVNWYCCDPFWLHLPFQLVMVILGQLAITIFEFWSLRNLHLFPVSANGVLSVNDEYVFKGLYAITEKEWWWIGFRGPEWV